MSKNNKQIHAFEKELSVSKADIELELRGFKEIPWLDFYLNPRRLRGSDFLMRWSQGVWSEQRITQGINETKDFFALPYGTSSTAPEENIRKYELYFELLDQAGHGQIKRPDLLIFHNSDKELVNRIIKDLEARYRIPFVLGGCEDSPEFLKGEQLFPFIHEDDPGLVELLSRAIIAIECENSLWKARMMPDYNIPLKPQKRLNGNLGLKKNAVLPTIIVKDEDLQPLTIWQNNTGVKIHVWHVFYDMAFGISLDSAIDLINNGLIEATANVFQAPNGTTTTKMIYKIYYHYAYQLGLSESDPKLKAQYITDKNGHILPYVHFDGGHLKISEEALTALNYLHQKRS